MNYYERHLGDYAKDTSHLSILEHGVYGILLDRYYSTEAGIPADQAYRVARARTEEERQAVDAVLEEFFSLEDGVWINSRAEAEIDKARVKIDAARENGKKGGRPKNKPEPSENETQQKPTGLFLGFENETQKKAHQAPDTNKNLKPLSVVAAAVTGESVCAKTEKSPPPADAVTARSLELAVLLRQHGAQTKAGDPRLRGIAESGASDAQVLTALGIAQQRRADSGSASPIHAGYIASILPDVMQPQARGSPGKAASKPPDRDAGRIAVARSIFPEHFASEASHERTIDAECRHV